MQAAGYAWLFIFVFVGAFETWATLTNHATLSEFCWGSNLAYYGLAAFFAILNLHLFGRLFK